MIDHRNAVLRAGAAAVQRAVLLWSVIQLQASLLDSYPPLLTIRHCWLTHGFREATWACTEKRDQPIISTFPAPARTVSHCAVLCTASMMAGRSRPRKRARPVGDDVRSSAPRSRARCCDPRQPLDVAAASMAEFETHVIACIATHGFCVLRVGREARDAFDAATRAARRFFHEVPVVDRVRTRRVYKETDACGGSNSSGGAITSGASAATAGVKSGSTGGLWGYSTPSTAKQLFRMRRGPACPWPAQPACFRSSMLAAQQHLEDINHACLSTLLAGVQEVLSEEMSATGEASPRQYYDGKALLAAYTSVSHLSGDDTYLHSPFDAFYYHNRDYEDLVARPIRKQRVSQTGGDTQGAGTTGVSSSAATAAPAEGAASVSSTTRSPNCLPHVDPGFLSCIPVAATPGLMVKDALSQDWVDVEALPTVQPLQDVVVFSGHSLAVASQHRIPATVHIVRGNDRPRLSLVYERRLEDGGDGWDMKSARVRA